MADITLFEKLVRTCVGDKVKDRAPTEEELLDACALVRRMLPVSDEEAELPNILPKEKRLSEISKLA